MAVELRPSGGPEQDLDRITERSEARIARPPVTRPW
jgi:hypothetical protein